MASESPAPGVGPAAGGPPLSIRAQQQRRRQPPARGLRFGALADIQYADIENRGGRRYRDTLNVARRAVDFFNGHGHGSLNFVLHAGDIVDFNNTVGEFAGDGGQGTARALGAVMSILSRVQGPLVSLVGNHELYNWSRENLLRGVAWEDPNDAGCRGVLRLCPEGSRELYHSFSPCDGWRCVVLDPYDVSIYRGGRTARPPPFNFDLEPEALAEVCSHNPNVASFVQEHPGENVLTDYFAGYPPSSLERRWVPFNGGIGPGQLRWLEAELGSAAGAGERAVVLSHVLLHPGSCPAGSTLIWNYEDVLAVVQSAAGRSVQLVVSGHQHEGGFHTDEHGIHYLVLESPLNTGEGQPGCFLVAEVGDQTLELSGYCNAGSTLFPAGEEGSPCRRSLPLRSPP